VIGHGLHADREAAPSEEDLVDADLAIRLKIVAGKEGGAMERRCETEQDGPGEPRLWSMERDRIPAPIVGNLDRFTQESIFASPSSRIVSL
jgi:hypothetical protein